MNWLETAIVFVCVLVVAAVLREIIILILDLDEDDRI